MNKNIKFPILMSLIACGDDLLPIEERMIVLFWSKNSGVVVQDDGWIRKLGERLNTWVDCDDSGHWEMVPPDYEIKIDNNVLLGDFYCKENLQIV